MNYMYIESAKKVIKYIPVAFLGFVTVWLRFSNLWYSDYQGDEIKALFIPNPGQSVVDFLLTQRKGPIQFLVTFLVKLVDPTYANEFLTRLPFALAGALAIYFFYKFVSRQFGKKIALYSSLFLSVNGIIVAFSRIAQYQSFVILFCVLALYLFSLALNCDGWRYKGIYLGAVAWALALLAHYDAVLIFPYALYLVIKWYKKHPQNALKHLAFASVVPGLLLSAFYIPFVLSINPATKEYWADRLSGGSDKLSSSIVTFKTYNPKLIFYIYSLLFIASLVKIKTVWAVKSFGTKNWCLRKRSWTCSSFRLYGFSSTCGFCGSHARISVGTGTLSHLGAAKTQCNISPKPIRLPLLQTLGRNWRFYKRGRTGRVLLHQRARLDFQILRCFKKRHKFGRVLYLHSLSAKLYPQRNKPKSGLLDAKSLARKILLQQQQRGCQGILYAHRRLSYH
ncbi:MAG: Glycosyl transferase family 39 [candidate division WWE3 bacterium GW2011_GWA2_46_9]|uniref:Glycosyl transferase family 39 n=1 Tax=candidate division WWE3 bacterium GW2011_GWA2_46_9 TaxID=1619111 RepID=A0A0G1QVP7_UNCKA|nr:MAG: Glycosyl transferase family 39 [candidate division WWE3 bacterium GW2011_GWA2_46_9]